MLVCKDISGMVHQIDETNLKLMNKNHENAVLTTWNAKDQFSFSIYLGA